MDATGVTRVLTVIELEVAADGSALGRLEVITQLTTCPLVKVLVV
jgi:hypothetical protein